MANAATTKPTRIDALPIDQQRVFIRVDFNVPIDTRRVTDDTRIVETLPTIQWLMKKGAKVILMTHLGRPDGKVVDGLKLDVIASHLGKLLGKKVPKQHNCIGPSVEAAISKMKPTSVVVNISRGPVIDELALIAALKSGRLFAAGLDVFETEPGPIRAELRGLPNVFCLPHIASATQESRIGMAMRALANIDAYFETGSPVDRVASGDFRGHDGERASEALAGGRARLGRATEVEKYSYRC